MATGAWPTLRERRTRVKGRDYRYWVVDCGIVDGRRFTKQFKSKPEAERYAEQQRTLRRQYGRLAFRLSDEDRLDASHALRILAGRSTLSEAAEMYVRHTRPAGGDRRLQDTIEEYIQEAQHDNLRPSSIKDLRNRLGRFLRGFPDSLISGLTRDKVEEWIRGLQNSRGAPLSELSKRHYRTVIGGLFNYSLEHDYVAENPLARKTARRRRNGGVDAGGKVRR